ncbi:MAG: polymorphic toxin-type HINT domain-containing protein [Gallionella sp.]|nr:polymorphic toxin-type HINT domain-containing protein [Gallionella sp.]MDD4958351.1 polymorphic toxin-type HINT domain-containing protein [Gallionella sp.]
MPIMLNYNFNLKLRTIGRIPPFEAVLNAYQKIPDIFYIKPDQLIVGLNNYSGSEMYKKELRVCSELTDPRYPEMKNGCFVAGTLVWTDKGQVPIEQIKVGDRVLSKPENGSGEQTYKTVVNTFVHEDKEIWFFHYIHDYTMAETVVYGTANHPVWVDGKGWTSIDSLRPGNRIVTEDGREGVVANAQPVWATTEEHIGFRCWSYSDEHFGSRVDFSNGIFEIECEDGGESIWCFVDDKEPGRRFKH